jgi:hypothetical protein
MFSVVTHFLFNKPQCLLTRVRLRKTTTLFGPLERANFNNWETPRYAECFKKSFTTLKAYIDLFREHIQYFELS